MSFSMVFFISCLAAILIKGIASWVEYKEETKKVYRQNEQHGSITVRVEGYWRGTTYVQAYTRTK